MCEADGIRAKWNKTQFILQNGTLVNPPSEFCASLPRVILDGFLTDASLNTSTCYDIIRTNDTAAWKSITFNVLDMPEKKSVIEERIHSLQQLGLSNEFVRLIPHVEITGNQSLMQLLECCESGTLLLRKPRSSYYPGLSPALLQLHRTETTFGRVVSHSPSKEFVCCEL